MEVGPQEEIRLEQWTVRPRLLSLDGPEGLVRLQPRVMGVLVALAARSGEVVTRDELVRDVWAGRVVSDDAINRCIVELRRALRDDGTGSVIETFNARVQEALAGTVWNSGCRSWYQQDDGRNVAIWPWSTWRYCLETRKVRTERYHFANAA